MAEGDINLNPQLLQTPEGVSQINSMFRQLFDLVPGDGETVRIYKGYGSPETVINAGIGSVYLRLDGSTGTTIYMKESGILATGWIAVAQLTTPISLANGGTGQSLSDPGADRILFWDDSASAISFLTVSTGLDLTTTNLKTSIPVSDDTSLRSILAAASASSAHSGTSATKKHEWTSWPFNGVVSLSMSLQTGNSGHTANSRVYINGSAVGSTMSTNSVSPVTKTQNEITVDLGDAVQVYSWMTTTDGSVVTITNLAVYGSFGTENTGL